MNSRRGATRSPINTVKIRSASAASSISTRLKVRFRVHGGFHSCCGIISPNLEPLDGVVGITGELVLNQVSEFAIAIAGSDCVLARRRRTGNVDVALLNQRSLIAIEKVNNSVRICAAMRQHES